MNNLKYTVPLTSKSKLNIEGIIKLVYKQDIKFNICKITYEVHENGYQYIFEPYYDIIDALPSNIYQGIPGLNLDKRKERYYRVNIIPVFISERAIGKNRENMYEELNELGMDSLIQLEWLIRTNKSYSGDNLIVERYRTPMRINDVKKEDLMYGDYLDNETLLLENSGKTKELLKLIGSGVDINCQNLKINNINRAGCLQMLIYQYELELKKRKEIQKEGILKAKENKVYKGRKKITVDDILLEEVIKKIDLKLIDMKEAMRLTKIKSRSTLYRKIKEFKNK